MQQLELSYASHELENCFENVCKARKKLITPRPSCTITGEEMKQKLSGFLQIMYDLNPDAVGGAMPGDDFYYIPANN